MSLRSLASPWLAALLLQAILTSVLLVKSLWKRFPFFFCYSALNFTIGLTLYAIYNSTGLRHFYFRAYWLNEGMGLILGMAVVYELFSQLLAPYPALRKLAKQVFLGAAIFLVILACVVVYAQPVGERHPLMAAFYVTEQAARILEVGLLCFLFVFASAFGLHWRQYLFGIALGLGIFATVELVGITMRLEFGVLANRLFGVIRTVSFNASLIIWISYLLAPELVASPADMPKRAQLEQWNNAIMELIYQ